MARNSHCTVVAIALPMRALIQRVTSAHVNVEGETVGKIGVGIMVLVCAMPGDNTQTVAKIAAKISKLRIFQDEEGQMNKSVIDIGGSALVVSQFTLAADTRRGNRPGFSGAAAPDLANAIYENFCDALATHDIPIEKGVFGADMAVSLTNDGPVTIWMDTADQ